MTRVLSSNRRIARNTLMLYLRMLLSVVVGLYTSRIVLQTLGVEDFGIYGLVGGIISIFGFLNTSLAGATSRFITYDLGIGNQEKVHQTFNAAFQSHLIIALLIVIFAETIGLWYVNHKLVIPQDRFFAAQCIYQFSILSALIGITQVPYTALVMAYEHMDVYALLEILNVLLKLLIVWLLQIVTTDSLIFYGALSLMTAVIIRFIYRIYCHRHYPESHLRFSWEPQILRQLLSFTSWNLYSDASVSVRQQGISILINRFFGVALNASCSLASMIQGFYWVLGYNVLAAFRPQIIKQFAASNYCQMQLLMERALKFTLILLSLLTIPTIVEMPLLLQLWLEDVPPYAVSFCRILLVDNLLGLVNYIVNLGVYAQGNIRTLSLVSGSLKFLCIPIIFLLFSNSFSPSWAFLCNLLCLGLILICDLYILKVQVPQLKVSPILITLSKVLLILGICSMAYFVILKILPYTFFYKTLSAVSFGVLLVLSTYFFILDHNEQRGLRDYLIESL